jgi:hypothetical protein
MKILLISIIVLASLTCYGQASNLPKLKKTANRLKNEIKVKSDSLSKIETEIKYIEAKGLMLALQNEEGNITLPATIKMKGNLRPDTEPMSRPLTTVNEGDTVLLTGYKEGYWIVNRGEFYGYLNEVFLEETEKTGALKNLLIQEQIRFKQKAEAAHLEKERNLSAKEKEQEKQRATAHRANIYKKYGQDIGNRILKGQFWIGMTQEMAVQSLGRPNKVNRTVGSWGTNEQWVYGSSTYLYFSNGRLDSYQN